MPHVEIKCFTGRTNEQKKACAEKISEVISETLGCRESSVSVVIIKMSMRKTGDLKYGRRVLLPIKITYSRNLDTHTTNRTKKVSGQKSET